MAEQKQQQSKLSLELSPEQLKELAPLIETMGQVKIAGTVEGNTLHVSFIACNAAFIACNAAFKMGNSTP